MRKGGRGEEGGNEDEMREELEKDRGRGERGGEKKIRVEREKKRRE